MATILKVKVDFMSRHFWEDRMRIGQLAHAAGVAASTIRYYEKVGLLPPAARSSGARVYSDAAVRELSIIRFAQMTGFTLREIRQLLRGFPTNTPPSTRWAGLVKRKIAELEEAIAKADLMRKMLVQVGQCRCETLDDCARALARNCHVRKAKAEAGVMRRRIRGNQKAAVR
jgi:DNA-binding transcriptional MerR regulator